MKAVVFFSLLTLLASCGNPHLNSLSDTGIVAPAIGVPSTPSTPIERKAVIAPGTYSSGCLVGTSGRYKVRVIVTETEMKMWYVLFRDSICNAPFYKYFTDYSVEKVIYKSDANDEDILVDLKRTSYRYVWSHPWYIGQNYCGITDWVIFAEKEIAAVNCPILTDRVDGVMPANGEKAFLQMKLNPSDSNYLGMPFGKDEPGQEADNRYGSDGDLFTMTLGAY